VKSRITAHQMLEKKKFGAQQGKLEVLDFRCGEYGAARKAWLVNKSFAELL